MWVLLSDWMVADREPPTPTVGAHLLGLGVRLRGHLATAQSGSPDAIELSQDGAPHEVMYRLTGTAGEPKDVWADDERGHSLHSGAEFVLTVREDLFHVHVVARACNIASGSRQAVEGRLAILGAYEWEAFGLADTRTDWYVEAMDKAPNGDMMLDLRPQLTR